RARDGAVEEGDPAEVVDEPVVEGQHGGREHLDSPEAEDHGGNSGKKVDHVAEALRYPPRCVVRYEERDADREGQRYEQREKSSPDGTEGEGANVGPETIGATRQLCRVCREHGDALRDKKDGNGSERDEDEAASHARATREYPVG